MKSLLLQLKRFVIKKYQLKEPEARKWLLHVYGTSAEHLTVQTCVRFKKLVEDLSEVCNQRPKGKGEQNSGDLELSQEMYTPHQILTTFGVQIQLVDVVLQCLVVDEMMRCFPEAQIIWSQLKASAHTQDLQVKELQADEWYQKYLAPVNHIHGTLNDCVQLDGLVIDSCQLSNDVKKFCGAKQAVGSEQGQSRDQEQLEFYEQMIEFKIIGKIFGLTAKKKLFSS